MRLGFSGLDLRERERGRGGERERERERERGLCDLSTSNINEVLLMRFAYRSLPYCALTSLWTSLLIVWLSSL